MSIIHEKGIARNIVGAHDIYESILTACGVDDIRDKLTADGFSDEIIDEIVVECNLRASGFVGEANDILKSVFREDPPDLIRDDKRFDTNQIDTIVINKFNPVMRELYDNYGSAEDHTEYDQILMKHGIMKNESEIRFINSETLTFEINGRNAKVRVVVHKTASGKTVYSYLLDVDGIDPEADTKYKISQVTQYVLAIAGDFCKRIMSNDKVPNYLIEVSKELLADYERNEYESYDELLDDYTNEIIESYRLDLYFSNEFFNTDDDDDEDEDDDCLNCPDDYCKSECRAKCGNTECPYYNLGGN